MSNPTENLASSFMAMAQAVTELPAIKAELADARVSIDAQQATIQRLELKLIERANQIDNLNASVRKVEVERDHAEQMFLEADDKLNGIKSFLSNQIGSAQSLFAALEPPKPEPTPEPVAPLGEAIPAWQGPEAGGFVADAPQDERAVDPTPVVAASDASGPTAAATQAVASDSEGVSVQPDPTPATETSSGSGSSGWAVSAQPEQKYMEGPIATGDWGRPIIDDKQEAPQERPTDPTAAATHTETPTDATSTGADVSDVASASTTTEQPSTSSSASEADIGYHNEPKIDHASDTPWAEWDKWEAKMRARYGTQWPQRPQAAQ